MIALHNEEHIADSFRDEANKTEDMIKHYDKQNNKWNLTGRDEYIAKVKKLRAIADKLAEAGFN